MKLELLLLSLKRVNNAVQMSHCQVSLMASCPTREIEEGCENWPYTSSLDFQIFPISSPFKNCQSIWGNVLRIDFPIYIFHSFSCSGKSRLTCVWLLGKKKGMEKKLRRSVKMVVLSGQLFIDFAWVILVFGRVARVMIFFEWTTLNVRAFLECLACLGLLSSWTQKKKMNQHFSVQ